MLYGRQGNRRLGTKKFNAQEPFSKPVKLGVEYMTSSSSRTASAETDYSGKMCERKMVKLRGEPTCLDSSSALCSVATDRHPVCAKSSHEGRLTLILSRSFCTAVYRNTQQSTTTDKRESATPQCQQCHI